MLFPTIDFAVFFVVVFTASWLLRPWPAAWRVMILAASYVFYGWWDWRFVMLLAASTVINQAGALLSVRLPHPRWRRGAMVGALVADVGVLAWFKYYGFLAVNVANALHGVGVGSPLPILQVALPVGISFFTFMGISYVVDCYRGSIEPASWMEAGVYLAFFPHLVAGPIVRGSDLFPQLRARRDPTSIDATRAGWLILSGLVKKVVISSFLARAIVDPVFALPHQHSGVEILVAVYAYAIQIYADFSGYTDIAIGIALLLGFTFPANFDAPYTATSIQDFWRRWHITLSTWLRDYVYIPLGGNRHGRWRTAVNIMITMLIGGFWHGAAWTFVAWGALHGLAQVVGMVRRGPAGRRTPTAGGDGVEAGPTGRGRGRVAAAGAPGGRGTVAVLDAPPAPPVPAPPVPAPPVPAPPGASTPPAARIWLARLATFHLVCLGWVLFRAESFGAAVTVLSRLVHGGRSPLVTPLVVVVIAGSLASQFVPSGTVARAQARLAGLSPVAQGAILAVGLYLVTAFGPTGVAPFIYYRF